MNTPDHLDAIAQQIENEVLVLSNRAKELRQMASDMPSDMRTVQEFTQDPPPGETAPYHDPNSTGSQTQRIHFPPHYHA